ncbi:MAG: 50S ribosomal protein L6 [Deltaproteobacteria bacterium]|nr:50S ribosomal protein L6 [Deltaproteobacteria bacterium]
MSRIGKKTIMIPDGVTVTVVDGKVDAKGPRGILSVNVPTVLGIEVDAKNVTVKSLADDQDARSLHGLTRTLLANAITGVSAGFQKGLEVVGVGYRGEVDGSMLRLYLGYSRPVEYKVPEGIALKVEKQVNIVVSGIDKELVGKTAAEIRSLKRPEPYKGKGIRYAGELVRRKVGKSAGA